MTQLTSNQWNAFALRAWQRFKTSAKTMAVFRLEDTSVTCFVQPEIRTVLVQANGYRRAISVN